VFESKKDELDTTWKSTYEFVFVNEVDYDELHIVRMGDNR
jgi:hypothetical protein